MKLIGLCPILPFLDIVAMTLISLEFNYTRTDCEKGKVEIHCIVDSKLLPKIDSITLKRFNEDAAMKWEELAVFSKGVVHVFENTNRSGVDVDGLISYDRFSYLTISIVSAVFNPLEDKGPYMCSYLGFGKNGQLITENATSKMLNITDQECRGQTTNEIQYTDNMSTVIHEKTQSNNTKNMGDFSIGTYNVFIVVAGVLICLILLLIMMREIRMYYCTSEDIVYV